MEVKTCREGIEPSFQGYIDNFMNSNPELKDRIIFNGRINDRN